jgi:sensor histidine kinase YesM
LCWLLCGAIHTSDWLKSKLPFKGKYAAQLNFWLISELVLAMIISWVSLYFTYTHDVAKDPTTQFFNMKSLHSVLNLNNYLIFPHALILMVYRASRMSDEQKLLKLEKAQLEKENIRAQFEALRQQVNPHFLFNSLNSLKALASTHPEQVENYVIQLSSTYRYLLNHRSRDLVLLREELEFLKSYFYLLNMRFEKALEISIDIDAEYHNWNIPPLTLQILIENAVKHNIISTEKAIADKIVYYQSA